MTNAPEAVWLVQASEQYEGPWTLGVAATEEAAKLIAQAAADAEAPDVAEMAGADEATVAAIEEAAPLEWQHSPRSGHDLDGFPPDQVAYPDGPTFYTIRLYPLAR